MKNIVFTFFCFLSLHLYSQNEDIITLNKSYEISSTDKTLTVMFPKKETIAIDTTVVKIYSSQLHFLKDFSILDNTSFIKNYKKHVFKSSKIRKINQFAAPIVIYIDKKLPKKVISDFTDFINDIPKIKNLEFSITNDIDNANYFIEVLNTEVSAFTNKHKEDLDEDAIKNYTFSRMTYKMYNNSNNKFISCHYKISP
ncbi:hypothetical protein [Lacinutrix sp.]|uniref:hypothetical protein n=1 Tax=Lacinutrix sp. TaxID=1937692 RepID=UPI0035C7BD88